MGSQDIKGCDVVIRKVMGFRKRKVVKIGDIKEGL